MHAPIFLRVCWRKALIGGWCTSSRLHTGANWDCIFGCNDRDEFRHYIVCQILWQFAREQLGIKESYVGHFNDAEERLCTVHASVEKLKLLSFVHLLYMVEYTTLSLWMPPTAHVTHPLYRPGLWTLAEASSITLTIHMMLSKVVL